jgi:hypothetical protein
VTLDNQVDGNVIFKDRYIGVLLGHGDQDSLHLSASHILGVDDAAARVASLASQIEGYGFLLSSLEAHTHFG